MNNITHHPYKLRAINLEVVRDIFKDKCAKCDSIKNLQYDHFFPKMKPKNTDFEYIPVGSIQGNIQILCRTCNYNKTNKNPIEWLFEFHCRRFEFIMCNLIDLGANWLVELYDKYKDDAQSLWDDANMPPQHRQYLLNMINNFCYRSNMPLLKKFVWCGSYPYLEYELSLPRKPIKSISHLLLKRN